MNVVNHLGGAPLVLRRAILIREGEREKPTGRSVAAVASIHDVRCDARGRHSIGAGQLLNEDGLRALVNAIVPKQSLRFIDGRVLAFGVEGVMWWRPAGEARIWFKTDQKADGIGEKSGRIPLPGLVFFAGSAGWYVFAVRGAGRPARDTPLHHCACYNVWRDGKICVGNADVPRGYDIVDIDGYERAFLESRFTHPNVARSREITSYRGGAGALWRSLLGGRRKAFPESCLVPIGATLGQWLDARTGSSTADR